MRPLRTSIVEPAALVGLFVYLLWFRVHGLAEGFVLMGDQIRDWDVALRGLAGLPLGGVPSSAGGTTVGPAYYWVLWAIRSVVGPAFDNLPHAGGVGIALVQSAADVVLAWALLRRTGSLSVALAVVLLQASSVYDAVLSSTIWNPPVAEAFVKLAIAAALVDSGRSLRTAILVAVTAWAAVQCHTSGVLVAAPLLAWTVLVPALDGRRRDAAMRAVGIAVSIAVLEVPWLINAAAPGVQGQTNVGDSLRSILQWPLANLRVGASAHALAGSLHALLMTPFRLPLFGTALAAGGALLIGLTRDARLAICGPVSLLTAVAAFSLWQGPTFEQYWYLVCLPPAAITLLAWVAYVPKPQRRLVGLVALAVVVAAQPARFALVRATGTYPGYGAMVRGCRQIVADDRPVVTVVADGPMMAAVDPMWLCSILNVRLAGDATEIAVIDVAGGGTVHYRKP